MAATHRLAARSTVSVEELAGEEVALLPPSTPPAVYDLLIPPLPLGLVWCTSRENPRIRALNEVARSLAAPDPA